MNLKFLKSSDKKRLLEQLEKQFGILEIPFGILVETGKSKIRGFSGHMTKDEIRELSEIANVEIVGMYLVKRDGELRLSLDGSGVFGKQVSKRIVEFNDSQMEEWMNGKSLDMDIVGKRAGLDRGVWVVKCGRDFLGCGISDGKKLLNYVPRERRIRRS